MNIEIQIFNNPEFGTVRTLEENGVVLFCGSDVAKALGYAKPSNAISTHCRGALKRGIGVQTGIRSNGMPAIQNVEMLFIPESDLYRLVFSSKVPTAEKFTDWVTCEVLPSIRQHGSYQAQPPMSPAQLIAAQAQVLVDMEQKMLAIENQQQELSNKVDTALKAFSRPKEDSWKKDMDRLIRETCEAHGYGGARTRGKLYAELEEKCGCCINTRLTNLRKRMKRSGMRHRDVMAFGKLDAIAADKQLRAVFEVIVKEWQVSSSVVEGQQNFQDIVEEETYQQMSLDS